MLFVDSFQVGFLVLLCITLVQIRIFRAELVIPVIECVPDTAEGLEGKDLVAGQFTTS